MSKVFISHYTNRRDFSDAVRYGELVAVTEREIYPDEAENFRDAAMEDIRRVLKNYDIGKDYLLLSGSPIIIGLCTAYLWGRHQHSFKVLQYDKQERKYWPLVITAD